MWGFECSRALQASSAQWCYYLGEGAEAAGDFYGCSSTDNLFSGTPLLTHFYDIINPPDHFL